MQLLDESEKERKWPKWLRYIFVTHITTLFWAMVSIPSEGTGEIAIIIFLMWLPLFLFAGYYFEKPRLNIGWYRKIYLIMALVAIFFNIMLALAFIE